ncbi:MAG: PKD domain-containing protein [Bacteroidales bacterium]
MKKSLPTLMMFCLIVTTTATFAQKDYIKEKEKKEDTIINVNPDPDGEPWIAGGIRELTSEDYKKLENVPSLSERVRIKRALPERVNNAELPYFREIFNQTGNCCAQASGVAYHYTYEMNRLKGTEANSDSTLFPSHYTWNLVNYGQDYGSWYFDGWDKIIENGVPTIKDFGSIDADGDETFWMSGYDKYLNAMSNRIKEYYKVNLTTEQGREELKSWIHDHGRGDEHGGLANFSALSSGYEVEYLESGEQIITSWGDGGAHAMTIVGYDDNICINGDCGAFIVANSWGKSWGNDGFIYMPYSLCSKTEENGGLQENGNVYVIDVEENNSIDLTMKVTLAHSNRSELSYEVSYNPDINASEGTVSIDHETFANAGGEWPMGGKTTGDNDEFTFGLDLEELKSEVEGNSGKFFLNIQSSDGEGIIHTASLMDYTRDDPEFIAEESNVSIEEGDNILTFKLYDTDKPRISASGRSNETVENNGSLEDIDIELTNLSFKNSSGNLTEGSDYTLNNLPDGLDVEIIINDANNAVLNFSGKANEHDNINDESNFEISFKESAFDADDITDVANTTSTVYLNFNDPYKVVFIDMDSVKINSINDWHPFDLGFGDSEFGGWYDDDENLRIETYTKSLVCEGTDKNIAVLPFNTEIGPTSNWVEGGEYPDEHYLRTPSYTEWDGEHGYVGIQISKAGETYYGWLEISVSEDGSSFIIHSAAYYNKPNGVIKAGNGPQPTLTTPQEKVIWEDDVINDGTVTEKINFKLLGTNINYPADTHLEEETDFNITGLPEGLTSAVKVLPDNTLQVYFNGKATNHEESDKTNDIKIEFTDNVFDGNTASEVLGSRYYFDINFIDEYNIIYDDLDDITASASEEWTSFYIDGNEEASFGAWYFEGKLKIETYERKALTSVEGEPLLKLIEKDEIIEGDSEFWTTPGYYPDQHNVYTEDYTEWVGKDGYVGVTIDSKNGKPRFGWIHVNVGPNGNAMTITEAAYHEGPLNPIKAGSTESITTPSMSKEGEFIESYANDGSLNGNVNISIINETFNFTPGQELSAGKDYTIENLPDGLDATVTAVDVANINVEISGNATNHTVDESTSLKITFPDEAFSSGDASVIEKNPVSIGVTFKGPFEIIYTDIDDITVDESNEWKWFHMGMGSEGFGAYWNSEDDVLTFATYDHWVVGYEGTLDITPLEHGDVIGEGTEHWVKNEDYDFTNLHTSTFTEWAGKEAYVGVNLDNGEYSHYGWIRIEVASDASSYTVKDFAYYDAPNMPIKAGFKEPEAVMPIADFNYNKENLFEGDTIQFTDESANGATSWNWEFEGGSPSSSNEENPEIIYNTSGTYNVKLIVNNDAGADTLFKQDIISVEKALPPVANFSASSTEIYEGGEIDFSDLSTNIPTSFEWTFEGGSPASSNEQNPSVEYETAGTYAVHLKVENEFGNDSTVKTNYITVEESTLPDYCDGDIQEYEHDGLGINNINLSNIDNNSDRPESGYSDFTDKVINLNKGEDYDFEYSIDPKWEGNAFQAWIDWNIDGTWTSEEIVFEMNGTEKYSGTISVPENAETGMTGMRVRSSYYGYEDGPCAVGYYMGEVEDYSVYITEAKTTLSLTASPEGSGTVNGSGEYEIGETVNLNATPATGYEFVNWTGDTEHIDNPESQSATVTMPAENIALTANFEESDAEIYPVTFEVQTGNGLLEASVNGQPISSGDEITEGSKVVFTATPDADNQVKDWIVDGSSIGLTDETYTISDLQSATDVKVEFEEIPTYTLTLNTEPAEGGEVHGGGEYEKNEEITVSATANEGYEFVNWTDENNDMVSEDAEFSYKTTDEDVMFTANFEEIEETYPVTFEVQAGNGTLEASVNGQSISSGDEIAEGSKVVFTATPDADNQVKNWVFDGSSIGSTDETYTISDLQSATDVKVEFEEIPTYTLTLNTEPAESGIASGGGDYEADEEITLSATANDGYEFVNWSGDTEYIDDTTSAITSLTMPNVDISLVANFETATAIDYLDTEKVKVFPNPVNNGWLKIKSEKELKTVSVISLSGTTILLESICERHSVQLDVSRLVKGIYLLKITTRDGIRIQKKFVIE